MVAKQLMIKIVRTALDPAVAAIPHEQSGSSKACF